MLDALKGCRRVLVVDECRRSGSLSEALLAMLSEKAPAIAVSRICGEDSFIPLGPAANAVLISEEDIYQAIQNLAQERAA